MFCAHLLYVAWSQAGVAVEDYTFKLADFLGRKVDGNPG